MRVIRWAVVLTLANVLADVAVGSPMMVLPQLLEQFRTDQAAWLSTSALLAGAIWSPLLAKASDIAGKRRILIISLVLSGIGAVMCLVAPTLWIFLVGRFFQGAAFAAVFLTVALVLQICAPATAMTVVGVVTSGSAVIGIVEPFLMQPVIDAYGHRSVFLVAVLLAVTAAVGVRLVVPESPIRTGGRIDVAGALLLGGGLAALLAYVSLGGDAGWLSGGMVALAVAGIAALAGWLVLACTLDEPIIDLRTLTRPILLTLLAVVLAAGAFRSMLQLTSIIAQVPAEAGFGYGLGDGSAVAVLLAAPNLGIVVGGAAAGWLAGRVGPAWPLLAGVALGTVATFAMVVGASVLPVAVACGLTIGVAAGAVGASGYNLATSLQTPQRQGVTAGMVSVMMALGSVMVTFAGGELLKATQLPGTAASSAAGVMTYIVLAGVVFAAAGIPAAMVAITRRRGARV